MTAGIRFTAEALMKRNPDGATLVLIL